MRRLIKLGAVAVGVLLLAIGVVAVTQGPDEYRLKVLMPAADGTFEGGKVMTDGRQIGEITDLGVRGDKALVTVSIERGEAPLHAGTSARVSWESVVGVRVLELIPGSESNPELASGKMITSSVERVELDDVLAALDAPTRKRLRGVVTEMQDTLAGREQEIKATLKAAGPTVQALGEVMRAVGDDGPAIRNVVTRFREVTNTLAARDAELGETVGDLGSLTSETSAKQEQLKAALSELPSTLRQVEDTLGRVPEAVDETVPLLEDLQPATDQLPGVARKLSPVLQDLQPTIATLRPTLKSAQPLLRNTPALLDAAHETLPGIDQAVTSLQPAVGFLRPYTPELVGWLSNWTGVFGSQNTSGHYGRALITASASSFNDNPGILPPGLEQDPRPAPGSIAGQAWTDANGDGVR